MLKSWFGIGILLAIAGLLLFQKGLSLRFDGGKPVYTTDNTIADRQASALATQPIETSNEVDAGLKQKDSPVEKNSIEASPLYSEPLESIKKSVSSGEVSPRAAKAYKPPKPDNHDDLYKKRLRKHLADNEWQQTDLTDLDYYLSDRRVSFRLPVLRKIVEHTESVAQYEQHLTPQSISMCLDFWNLKSDEITTGTELLDFPVEVVVAILKVESNFGKWPGKESIFNVYWTLALGDNTQIQNEYKRELQLGNSKIRKRFERKAEWGRKQLKDLLYMAKIGNCPDPVGVMGSWAGAFGLCQFIPASYRAFGRDGNKDGIIDLYNVADASASIAYYLVENGWPDNDNPERKKRALMRYNISEPYAECVLTLADSLKGKLGFIPSETAHE